MNFAAPMKCLALVTAGLGLALPAMAQYTGPSSGSPTSVLEILEAPKDDVHVTLQGRISEKVGAEKYNFVDDSGQIRVEIDSDEFLETVNETTLVEIRGEVEKDFMESPEIDVDSLRVIAP